MLYLVFCKGSCRCTSAARNVCPCVCEHRLLRYPPLQTVSASKSVLHSVYASGYMFYGAVQRCIPLNSSLLISFWNCVSTFCRLLTDTVRISSIPSCQVKSMCSNEFPIYPLSTPLIPSPPGNDRFAWNDFFRFDFLSTEDVDPEADC